MNKDDSRIVPTLEFHFKWNLESYTQSIRFRELIQDIKNRLFYAEESNTAIEIFTYQMGLAYFYYQHRDMETHKLHLKKAHEIAIDENLDNGLRHVFLCNFSTMLHGVGWTIDYNLISSFVNSFDALSSGSRATVYGVRALTMEGLGPVALAEAITWLEKATELEPKNWYWHLRLGHAVRKSMQKDPNKVGEKPELEHYRKVLELGGPKLSLANGLLELSLDLFRYGNVEGAKLQEMNRYISDVLRQTLDDEKDTLVATDYCKIGKLFNMLPGKMKDTSLAAWCFDKAIAMSPDNSTVNHYYGKHLLYHDKASAIPYLKMAVENSIDGNFSAAMDLFQTRCGVDEEFVLASEISQMLKKYQKPTEQGQLLCYLADYMLAKAPAQSLAIYEKAVKKCQGAGFEDWGKFVYKFKYQLQEDRSIKEVTKKLYEFQNVHEVIKQLRSSTL